MTASALVGIENNRHMVKEERLTELITFRKNCILKHVLQINVEGKLEGKRRRGRRCQQLALANEGMLEFEDGSNR
jgi:hypothetical protein